MLVDEYMMSGKHGIKVTAEFGTVNLIDMLKLLDIAATLEAQRLQRVHDFSSRDPASTHTRRAPRFCATRLKNSKPIERLQPVGTQLPEGPILTSRQP